MVAREADWSLLGSGARPASTALRVAGDPLDALDVADLSSEAEHDYQLYWANRQTNVVRSGFGAIDGGRSTRTLDSFRLELEPGGTFVARLGADAGPIALTVRAGERKLGELHPIASTWQELMITLPDELGARARYDVEVAAERGSSRTFTSLYYWSFPRGVVTRAPLE